MPQLLSDHIFSEQMSYESHRLVCTFEAETICIEGVFAAALVSALLVDTEEGKQREIAIDTDDERKAWMMRYEREVRQDDWGLFSTEIQLLNNAYIELATSNILIAQLCPNKRLLDLAMHLLHDYMQYLCVEIYGEHIWNCVPWQAPFPAWLLAAAQVETRRQRCLQTDWTNPLELMQLINQNNETNNDKPTFLFEEEPAEGIMQRYLDWLWEAYQTQIKLTPGENPNAPKHRNFVVEQETNWLFMRDEINKLSETDRLLWTKWMIAWEAYIKKRLKPQQPVRFWNEGVTPQQQAQLQQFLRIQEKEWDYYKCLAASVYAMRQLGYVRRACSVTDITRWLSEQLVNDYTAKNRRDQFRKAWNELGRYSDDVKHFVNVLNQLGVYSCS